MRPPLTFSALAAVAALASGCTTVGSEEVVQTAEMPGQLEPVHAAAFTQDTAVFWVSSNGCTGKDDVKPFISRLRHSMVITLRRLGEDTCTEPRADGVQLEWTFKELGLEPGTDVSVNNPYILRGSEGQPSTNPPYFASTARVH